MFQSPKLNKLDAIAGRNFCINGSFDFWQRGTSFNFISSGSFTADRMQSNSNWLNTTTIRSTDVPSNNLSTYSYQMTNNNSGTLGVSNFSIIEQNIEATFVQHLTRKAGAKITIGFWAKCSEAGIRSVALRSNRENAWANNRSYIHEFNIQAADTWEFFTFEVEFDGVGVWETGSDKTGLGIIFTLNSGSNFQSSTLDTWIPATAAEFASSNTHQLNADGAYLKIAQLQILEGSVELDGTEFVRAGGDYAEEFELCERYFELVPNRLAGSRYAGGPGLASFYKHYFRVKKRGNPVFVNISGATKITSGAPGPNQLNGLDYTFGAYLVGAHQTVSGSSFGGDSGLVTITPATIASSSVGGYQELYLGAGVIMGWDAEL